MTCSNKNKIGFISSEKNEEISFLVFQKLGTSCPLSIKSKR